MNQKKVISIDHGNRSMKTLNHVFPACYVESGHLPSFGGDTLAYKGKEYTLVDRRMPQKTDKTQDESYFILTLFAIGKELAGDMNVITGTLPGESIDVELLVGLPPLHCKEMRAGFKQYFIAHGEYVRFELNNLSLMISIVDVYVYPQAYAAAMTIREQIMDSQFVNLVDVGGFTVDILRLNGLRPDMSVCTSLYGGVNLLFQKINEQVRAKGAKNIPDSVIEGILQGDERILTDCSPERILLIRSCAEQFTKELVFSISQAGLDLTENRTVFVGGGSILLKEYIKNTGMVSNPLFVNNVRANAEGYQLLYDNPKSSQTQRTPQS